MTYRVEISSVAEFEADNVFLQISQVKSRQQARQWYKGMLKAVASLSRMPKRCSLARENDTFSQEIRQLLYGQGRNLYRIIFTVVEDDRDPIVRILHIRHVAQQVIGEIEEADED